MARPLRDLDPTKFKLVTIRTSLAQLWMVPSRKMNRIVGGALARYQESEGVEIYAFCILSNHMHLLVRSNSGILAHFFENVNREIARRINKLNDRIACFWGRRYDMQTIINEDDLLEAFLYITTNAVKHGLVPEARKWPGLSNYHQSLDQIAQTFTFTHYSLRDEQGNFVVTQHSLKVSRLPIFDSLSPHAYRLHIRKLLTQREQYLQEERYKLGKGFLGVKAILRQRIGSLSRETARSRRPICYTKCAEARRRYRRERKWIRTLYTEASRCFRSGQLETKFPEFCHKPPLHKFPVQRPRKILDDKYALSTSQCSYS